VIPGNHDIDWSATRSPEQRIWRSRPRQAGLDDDQRDQELIDLLEDETSAEGLFAPLAPYNRFAAAYGCAVSVTDPFWDVRLPINDRYEAQIRGLTSVLISDAYDKADRLVLGDVQVSDLQTQPGVLNVTLCHHPYSWLRDGERQRARLRRRSVLHVTGHEHSHSVSVDAETRCVQICLGALQPARSPDRDPRLYAFAIDVAEQGGHAEATTELFGARWDRSADQFLEDVDMTASVPVEPVVGVAHLAAVHPAPAVVRLVERLAALQSGDRLGVAADIGADLALLTKQPSYELPSALVNYAEGRGVLAELWTAVERRHAGQEAGKNPFKETP
jgi:hypothetical protein